MHKNQNSKQPIKSSGASSRHFTPAAAATHRVHALFDWIKTDQEANYAKLLRIARRYTPHSCAPEDMVHELALAWPRAAVFIDEPKLLAFFKTGCRWLRGKIARKDFRRCELDAMVTRTADAESASCDGEPLPAIAAAEALFRHARDQAEIIDGLTALIQDLYDSRSAREAHLARFLERFRDAADLQACLTQSVSQVPTARRLGVSQSLYSKYIRETACELAPRAAHELLR